MKNILGLLSLALAGLCIFLFFQWRGSNNDLDLAREEHAKEIKVMQTKSDSVIRIKNQYALDALNSRTEINTLRTENTFLKKVIYQDKARYERDKRTGALRLTDSAILRAWADLYKF